MMRKRENILRYALFAVALVMPMIVSAQEDSVSYRRERSSHSIHVDFRVNSTVIDKEYRDNSSVLQRVDSLFTMLKEDTTITIESVEFSGSASPEGPLRVNRRLSRARMDAVENFVRSNISIPEEIVTRNDRYVDWAHLEKFVLEDETLPMRDEVLTIIRSKYPDTKDYRGNLIDGRLPRLKRLDNGNVWRELLKRYFVQMRLGAVVMNTYVDVPVIIERKPEEIIPETPMEVTPESYSSATGDDGHGIDDMGAFDTDLSSEYKRTPLMSVKTNLMAYSTLIPNAGVEVRLADHWSAEITGLYSPFNLFSRDLKTRVLATKPEVRYWFGEAMRKGHFIGVHMPLAGFNIQLNEEYRYQDPNHALWGLGLNYGYMLMLGKKQNWTIDFTIGFGYMDVKYDVYEGVYNGKYIRTEEKHYFGPTRLGVNLAYVINKKKGK